MFVLAKMSGFIERGIWGVHIGRYDFTVKSPWIDAVPDLYSVIRVRRYKMGRWMIIISKFSQHG